MAQMMKQECDKDASESHQQQQQQQLQQQQQQLTDAIMSTTGQTSAALSMSAQAYQQVLQQQQQQQQQIQPQQQQQTSVSGGNLAHQLQFFQAPSNSAGAPLSLPWVVPPYQMMVLPQGVSQSLFAPNVLALQDNHILVTPMGDGSNGQQTEEALIQTAEGLVRQVRDTGKRPSGASPSQQLSSAAGAAAAADGHASVVHGGNMMTIGGGQVVGDGGAFNAHLANTTLESIVGRRQVEMAKPEIPKPPKKPLTPYMLFSKAIWPQVKAANSHLSSVCEIGAVVGALWRDLDPNEKQRYNELFAKDKERYDTELRLYLSTTGLHASDLVKPKQKRKDNRDKTARPASTTTLNTPSQQLVHTLMSNTPGNDPHRQQQTAAVATGGTSIQDWTGQVQQFASQQQQLLAQMGLAGQTLYANSDGSISVDSTGNIGGLVTFHPQSLQVMPGTSGPGAVAGTGGQIIYSDQRRGGLAQSSISKLDAGHSDPSRSWPQSQSNLVIYQASASTASSADQVQVKVESQRSQGGMKSGSKSTPDSGVLNGPVCGDHQGVTQYYSIDQLGQVIKCEEDVSRRNQLEAELLHLRSALSEKTSEVQSLNHKLEEAYRIIDRYKQQFDLAQPTAASGQSDRPVIDGNATDSVTATTTTNNVTSG